MKYVEAHKPQANVTTEASKQGKKKNATPGNTEPNLWQRIFRRGKPPAKK